MQIAGMETINSAIKATPSASSNYTFTAASQQPQKVTTLLNAKDDYYKKISANFRRRSFLTLEEQEYFISEKVRMLLKEECQKCSKILFPKDIMKCSGRVEGTGQGDSQQSYYAFRCSCFQELFPCLKIRIGDVSLLLCVY